MRNGATRVALPIKHVEIVQISARRRQCERIEGRQVGYRDGMKGQVLEEKDRLLRRRFQDTT